VLVAGNGRGADCVVEIGGAGTLANSIKALAVGGHGMTLGSISVGSRANFEAMNRAIALHRLRAVVDRVFPFEEAPDAYRYFESRAHFGKVVISHG
jgi:NADPH:quinone reductase-like Zn-dependent oxidoreductase